MKLLIGVLQSLLPETTTEIKEPPKHKSVIKTKTTKASASEFTENKFLTMGVKDLHKDDTIVDKALSKFPPTPRSRKYKSLDVVCRVCGKKESVNPAILYDSAERYKCNKCSSSAG